jgi:glutathione synthase
MSKRYPEKYQGKQLKQFWVLFVIEKNERNLGDQKCLETEIYDSHGIKTLRATFEDIYTYHEIDPVTRSLKVMGKEIGLVYYRTGY